MPEGPELLYFSTFLKKTLINKKIKDILSFTDKPVILPSTWDGIILDIDNKGKLLWFKISGKNNKVYYMHVHYGLTGWFTFDKPDKYIKFEFIITDKDKEYHLYLEDKRRFSKIAIYDILEHESKLNKLGIDIFSDKFTLEKFKEFIKSKNTMLASLLLKQDIFCGIGNYIKNEVMYLTKLKSTIKTSELNDEQIKLLYHNILFVAYSNLIEMLKNSKIEKYLVLNKRINEPKKLEVPYKYKIYGLEETNDKKKYIKLK